MNVSEALDKRIFWDVNAENLDWDRHQQFIIERTLTRGFTNDVRTIFTRYTKNEIAAAVLKSKVLDKKTANFISIYLNIPLNTIPVAPEYY